MNDPRNTRKAGKTGAMARQQAAAASLSHIKALQAIQAIDESAMRRAKHALLPRLDGTKGSVEESLGILSEAVRRIGVIKEREGLS